MRTRRTRLLAVLALVVGPFAWLSGACRNNDPPPTPTPAVEEEEKPKKKKKKSEDDETPDTGSGGDEAPTATATVKTGGTGTAKPATTGDADKNKLIACCTALRNAATAAGIANAAASNAIPGLPTPPPKEELDKSVKACDAAVVNWNGDLNESLKKVKGASPAKLPSVCAIGS